MTQIERQKELLRRYNENRSRRELMGSTESRQPPIGITYHVRPNLSQLKDHNETFRGLYPPERESSPFPMPIQNPIRPQFQIKVVEDMHLLNRICLKRNYLVKYQNHLHFDRVSERCLAKVHLVENGKQAYKLGLVLKVVRGD